jgi:hypothetical protein
MRHSRVGAATTAITGASGKYLAPRESKNDKNIRDKNITGPALGN